LPQRTTHSPNCLREPSKTVQGSDVEITVDGSSVMVNNANVVKTDVMASNGVIHVIDTVIIPSS
jgi:uncharacterized surface protein with fasciclin (FAS1) repeats